MPETAASSRTGRPLRAARAIALVAIAGVVYHGALDLFFGQDDFAGLARAGGLMPRLEGPWRWLSGQGYFDVMRALSGLDPRGYHLASLAAFAATAVLAFAAYGRRAAPAAAWLGAAFYAAHPAHFTAIYSVSGIGELLSPLLGLSALLALDLRGARRFLAPALFALSLACKETTLLLPLVALARPRPPGEARGSAAGRGARADLRDPAWAAMAVLAVAYAAAFLARDTFGIRSGLEDRAAYALRFDGTLLANALTYLGWTTNALLATTRSFSDAVDPSLAPWAIPGAAIGLGGLLSPALRARGWGFGVAWYAATLLPVLPLVNHTYHYYLVAPLIGAGACVAAAADLAWSRWASPASRSGGRPRLAAPAAALIVVLLGAAWTLNGALLVRKNETYPFSDPELRSDPTVDRARIARNVRDDLAAAAVPPGTVLRFWSPASIDRGAAAGRERGAETYWEQNVRHALLDGLGVRVLFPSIARVEFVRAFDPGADSVRWAVYLPSGHLRVATTSELAAALRDFRRTP